MKKSPTQVKLIGKKGNSYQIKFPHLRIPVTVNEDLYNKMLYSTEYEFDFLKTSKKHTFSA